jgi:hypothetical protein
MRKVNTKVKSHRNSSSSYLAWVNLYHTPNAHYAQRCLQQSSLCYQEAQKLPGGWDHNITPCSVTQHV